VFGQEGQPPPQSRLAPAAIDWVKCGTGRMAGGKHCPHAND
jgi:hypothetical protein